MTLAFTVPGEPRGKGRARHGRTRTGAPVTYTDDKTAAYENLVTIAARLARGPAPLIETAVQVEVIVRFAPPASVSKIQRERMLRGDVLPAKRPDLDNVCKSVLDGCNGVAFRDDAQIVRLLASKVYAPEPGVDVRVLPIAEVRA